MHPTASRSRILRRRPDDDLLRQPRQMRAADRGKRQEFEREVAVGYGIDRISRGLAEVERGSRHGAVDRKARAGKRRGTERALVHALHGIAHPRQVTPETFPT